MTSCRPWCSSPPTRRAGSQANSWRSPVVCASEIFEIQMRRKLVMSKLTGKIAVITGGSSGIGLAAAKSFVAEGAHVFITGRRESELVKAKGEIGRHGAA